jgi:hypothetical protein
LKFAVTHRSKRLRFVALLLGGVFAGACHPVVTHGPRVEPGVQLFGTLGSVRPLCDTSCGDEVVPLWGLGARYGFRSGDPEKPVGQVGFSVPLFDPTAPEIDLYVQGPGRYGPTAYGAGVLSSPRHVMPYVQFGQTPMRGVGWYVTPAYTWTFSHEDLQLLDGSEGDDFHVPPRYWSPAVTLRMPAENAVLDFYLQGAFGSLVRNVADYDSTGTIWTHQREPIRTLLLGVTLSLSPEGREDPFPAPPPQPALAAP